MDWNLRNIYQHKDTPMVDSHGGELRYTLSGRGGWDVIRGGRRVTFDVDGSVLCYILNEAQAEPVKETHNG